MGNRNREEEKSNLDKFLDMKIHPEVFLHVLGWFIFVAILSLFTK